MSTIGPDHRRKSTIAVRTRLICPECNAESFINLRKTSGNEVLCSCGSKIDISMEKYSLIGAPPARRTSYPREFGRHKLLKELGASHVEQVER